MDWLTCRTLSTIQLELWSRSNSRIARRCHETRDTPVASTVVKHHAQPRRMGADQVRSPSVPNVPRSPASRRRDRPPCTADAHTDAAQPDPAQHRGRVYPECDFAEPATRREHGVDRRAPLAVVLVACAALWITTALSNVSAAHVASASSRCLAVADIALHPRCAPPRTFSRLMHCSLTPG